MADLPHNPMYFVACSVLLTFAYIGFLDVVEMIIGPALRRRAERRERQARLHAAHGRKVGGK